MTTRNQEEIVERIASLKDDDIFGFRFEVLADALTFENAKQYLKDGVTEEHWDGSRTVDTAAAARRYLEFAVGKIRDERGLSAERSVIKLREYAWLLGRSDVVKQMDAAEYAPYGEPKVRAFAAGMGFDWPEGS